MTKFLSSLLSFSVVFSLVLPLPLSADLAGVGPELSVKNQTGLGFKDQALMLPVSSFWHGPRKAVSIKLVGLLVAAGLALPMVAAQNTKKAPTSSKKTARTDSVEQRERALWNGLMMNRSDDFKTYVRRSRLFVSGRGYTFGTQRSLNFWESILLNPNESLADRLEAQKFLEAIGTPAALDIVRQAFDESPYLSSALKMALLAQAEEWKNEVAPTTSAGHSLFNVLSKPRRDARKALDRFLKNRGLYEPLNNPALDKQRFERAIGLLLRQNYDDNVVHGLMWSIFSAGALGWILYTEYQKKVWLKFTASDKKTRNTRLLVTQVVFGLALLYTVTAANFNLSASLDTFFSAFILFVPLVVTGIYYWIHLSKLADGQVSMNNRTLGTFGIFPDNSERKMNSLGSGMSLIFMITAVAGWVMSLFDQFVILVRYNVVEARHAFASSLSHIWQPLLLESDGKNISAALFLTLASFTTFKFTQRVHEMTHKIQRDDGSTTQNPDSIVDKSAFVPGLISVGFLFAANVELSTVISNHLSLNLILTFLTFAALQWAYARVLAQKLQPADDDELGYLPTNFWTAIAPLAMAGLAWLGVYYRQPLASVAAALWHYVTAHVHLGLLTTAIFPKPRFKKPVQNPFNLAA